MMEVSEAVAAVLRETSPFEPQAISLLEALGLVLAEDVCANEDSPPFDKSLVDGFAVRLADCVTPLPVIEIVAAGQVPTRLLDCPAAIQIMTGAPLPAGAEVVIPVEHTSQTIGADERPLVALPSSVTSWKLGTNILRRGASTKLGDLVVAAGSELRPQELGTLAECGLSHVTARRRPRVAVLATGDELVPVEQTLGPGQIRNSNETMLCGQLLRACTNRCRWELLATNEFICASELTSDCKRMCWCCPAESRWATKTSCRPNWHPPECGKFFTKPTSNPVSRSGSESSIAGQTCGLWSSACQGIRSAVWSVLNSSSARLCGE